MGIYSRFKKEPEGFRHIVELLESTTQKRRKRILEVGMEEDPQYTQQVLEYVLTFSDVLELSDLELAEVLAETPGRFIGFAIYPFDEAIRKRFLSNIQPTRLHEVKDVFDLKGVKAAQIESGQMKVIATLRMLEKKGIINKKRIL